MANARPIQISSDPVGTASSYGGSVMDYRGGPLEHEIPGTVGQVYANPIPGYVFDHWTILPVPHASDWKGTPYDNTKSSTTVWWPNYDFPVDAIAHFRKVPTPETKSTLSISVLPAGAGDTSPSGTTYPTRGSSVSIRAIETDPENHPFERFAVTKDSGTHYFTDKQITIVVDDPVVFVLAYFREKTEHGILYSPKNNGRIICSNAGSILFI